MTSIKVVVIAVGAREQLSLQYEELQGSCRCSTKSVKKAMLKHFSAIQVDFGKVRFKVSGILALKHNVLGHVASLRQCIH